mgnify:CR=1 FL=1
MSIEGLINNDLNIPVMQQRVNLITGPNASGKTTFISQVMERVSMRAILIMLPQIALTVYMAHIGR